MLFSVIVPVCGVEEYISECIDSILSQSFSDFELIAVDDGSPDGCPAICDGYAKKDSRVKVIHKPNGGLVSARKAGVSAASGDYIINVDGDDRLRPGYFEKAKEIIEKNDPDIISFAVNYFYKGKDVYDPEMLSEGLYAGENIKKITDLMLLTPDMRHLHYFLWAKVFRRDIIKDIQISADERASMGEDVNCVIPAYCKAKSVYISAETVYDCRCRGDSMSRKYRPSHFDDIAVGVSALKKAEKAPDGYEKAVDRYAAFMFFVIFATAASDGDKSVKKYAADIFGNFKTALENAGFSGITAKSRIALYLLKKKKFGAAYNFLRVCEKLKGRR